MRSGIEQIIEEVEEYIDECKPQALNKQNIIVNREEIKELLGELRMKIPEEVKRYQKVLSNKEAILADAQAKADLIIQQANIHTEELVNEQEIMKQAYAKANEMIEAASAQAQQILDNATIDANNIRMGAMQYTDDMLGNLENIISHTLESHQQKYESMVNSMYQCREIVNNNRKELAPTLAGSSLPIIDTSFDV